MALLWHLNSLERLDSILSTMTLNPSRTEMGNYSDKTKHISLTRRHNAYSGYEKFFEHNFNIAVLALDKDMLQAKIKPFDYVGAIPMYQQGGRFKNGRDMYQKQFSNPDKPRDWNYYSQTEERVYTNKPISIKNALKGVEIVLNWVEGGIAGTIDKMEQEGPENCSREMMYVEMAGQPLLRTLNSLPIHPNHITFYDTWDDYNAKNGTSYNDLIDELTYLISLNKKQG